MSQFFDERVFTLQWHITACCQQRCKHCYMFESETYDSEIKNELSTVESKRVIDNFVKFCSEQNIRGRINFAGGDPLLRADVYELVEYARFFGVQVEILGNPFQINTEVAERLKILGISLYQLSLDGLKETHDRFRDSGSFGETTRAIGVLKKAGIPVCIMMTLSRENSDDLVPLMEHCSNLGVDIFAFARISCTGNATMFRDDQISPIEYKTVLLKYEQKAKELRSKGSNTFFSKKCSLWQLLDYERGLITLPKNKKVIWIGCSLAIDILTLLADGTIMACRRFPSIVGNIRKDSFYDVFLRSNKLDKYRDYSGMEKCSKCELLPICRGCPAVAYGVSGDWRSTDPQCWKEL
ncbi:MAG: radical SAM protein [Candidatus Bathyarchaeota archaeon]|uniref:radical SAM/SPASM domain-containing protein n=1 Tax=Candidatus Bathycorpusculum sp. TaxID=2994959 RepID=UPI002826CC34|nr:radical SAM protein [Candidatus Termiticorpusculum sp.]MCL2257955.1 radical SAM protein [Candidatus Termiticorpusculum sp.]MCL2291713.1 radical SAM protein [Candidatus Termiticorpusculum sp.]